jgi:hypothetical protein
MMRSRPLEDVIDIHRMHLRKAQRPADRLLMTVPEERRSLTLRETNQLQFVLVIPDPVFPLAERHAMPRCDVIPSKYPTKSIRKYTPGGIEGRPCRFA